MRRGKRFLHVLIIGILMFICMTSVLAAPSDSQAAYSILHNFAGGATDGLNPVGSLTLSESTLYGLTPNGPQGGLPPDQYSYPGTIFKIKTDGTGYQILHRFGDDTKYHDGFIPKGSLTLSGSSLYGFTTTGGGPGNSSIYGSVFKINTDGTGYQIIFGFGYIPPNIDNLHHPVGTPVISGSKLYGMASNEGIDGLNKYGAIFQMNTDGTGYELLHAFDGKPSDGATPYGSLTLVGSKLYGMTRWGGSFGGTVGGYGVIFSMNTNGTGYQVLHNFEGYPKDGNNPQGSLTLVGSKLYGMTQAGGAGQDPGVIFSLNLDGSGYQILFDFSPGNSNNPHHLVGPLGSLTFSGSRLYGMAHGGGPHGGGGVFQINLDGTGFHPLHYFNSFTGDGASPWGDVTLVESRLYGMTYGGGTSSVGVIFSCRIPRPNPWMMLLLLDN